MAKAPRKFDVLDTLEELTRDSLSLPASSNPGPWVKATLINSWANFGSGWPEASYRKGGDGRVQLRGLIKRAGAIAGFSNPPLVLAAGYRPPFRHMFTCPAFLAGGAGDTHVRVDVGTDGSVTCDPGGEYSYLALFTIGFYTT